MLQANGLASPQEVIDKLPLAILAQNNAELITLLKRLDSLNTLRLLEEQPNHGLMPLAFACQCRNTMAAILITIANPNCLDAKDFGHNTPVMMAVRHKLDEALAFFLKLKPKSLNDANELGQTALMIAVSNKEHCAAKRLLKAGASLKTVPGQLPYLHAALQVNDPVMTTLLIEHGADPNEKYHEDEDPIITTAAALGRLKITSSLAKSEKTKVDDFSKHGFNALAYLCNQNFINPTDGLECLGALLNAGARLHQMVGERTAYELLVAKGPKWKEVIDNYYASLETRLETLLEAVAPSRTLLFACKQQVKTMLDEKKTEPEKVKFLESVPKDVSDTFPYFDAHKAHMSTKAYFLQKHGQQKIDLEEKKLHQSKSL